jgi:LGFP repeat
MSLRFARPAAAPLLAVAFLCCSLDACVVQTQAAPVDHGSPSRGLLASPGLEGQPMKAVYFFPGERGKNTKLYTTHPTDVRNDHWNSDPSARSWVMRQMVAAHVNTVVMSYWSTMPTSSPMALDATSLSGVIEAVQGLPLRVLPAIESGKAYQFYNEFPSNEGGDVAPGLVDRIGDMVALFRGRLDLWAELYDRDGRPRYAVNIIHASSNRIPLALAPGAADDEFARAFDVVAAQVERRYGIRVGFTLDVVQGQSYSATPSGAGSALERTASVLAIQEFEPEVSSGVVKSAPPCSGPIKSCVPYDNNVENLFPIWSWKRSDEHAWSRTGVPIILSLSNGFDGRFVWARNGAGFWGDNMQSTDDRFRNWGSQLKGSGVKGVTFDTWNGYTEGYAAVPSTEHGDTVYGWLADLLQPDPRKCSHVEYANGAPTYRVYGSICRKWVRLGADRRLGGPVTPELASARGRVSFFSKGGAIYWGRSTGAHEVHGAIEITYAAAGADASCLGLPTSDEEADGDGRVSYFEHGAIRWKPRDGTGRLQCS